jgi:hypothetical protein
MLLNHNTELQYVMHTTLYFLIQDILGSCSFNKLIIMWQCSYGMWCTMFNNYAFWFPQHYSYSSCLIEGSELLGLTWHCPWSHHVQIACFFDLRSMGWVTVTLSFFHHHKVACLLISISCLIKDAYLIQTKKFTHLVDSPSNSLIRIIMQNHWLTSPVFIEGIKWQYYLSI